MPASAGCATVLAVLLGAGQTAFCQPDTQSIRIAVVQNEPQVSLAIHGRYRIVSLQDAGSPHEGRSLKPVAVHATTKALAVGEARFPMTGVRIEPARDAAITVNGRRLRGMIEILPQADRSLLVINHVGLEDYLRGVLSKEMPYYWHREALKAVAIAARTYAIFQRLTKTDGAFDVTGDVLSQLYGGKTAERSSTSKAVQDTEGWILVFEGRVFPAFYHSTCGGRTEHARVMGPYALSPLSGGIVCSFCADSPFYRWRRRLTKADVAWALSQRGKGSVGIVEDLQVARRTPTGRIEQLVIKGSRRSLTLTGFDFRALFGFERIRSTAFTTVRAGDEFFLEGGGWGHGVGLCQWGASELARRGFSAPEILAYYYPGAELVYLGELTVQPIATNQGSP